MTQQSKRQKKSFCNRQRYEKLLDGLFIAEVALADYGQIATIRPGPEDLMNIKTFQNIISKELTKFDSKRHSYSRRKGKP